MTTAGLVRVDARDVCVGDMLVFLGTTHRVSRIEPYEHPEFPGAGWRIAHEDATGWGITLIPGQWLDVAA